MVAAVVAFFVHPLLGVLAFVAVWVCAALGIAGFHLWNALSPRGVPVARFGFEASGPDAARSGQAARLRELEQLRADGLVSDEEYQKKRADILGEDW
jgi:hypothetical protein